MGGDTEGPPKVDINSREFVLNTTEFYRRYAVMKRMPVSEAVKKMIQFMEENHDRDYFLVGIPKDSNPFKEKKSCNIL